MRDPLERQPTPPPSAAEGTSDALADAPPPMLPSRAAFLLAFSAVVIAGILGGIIGYDVSSQSDLSHLVGTFAGSVIGAAGVGIVAVLVLRAMAEWRRQQ
jgi:uncharacterized membrane protein